MWNLTDEIYNELRGLAGDFLRHERREHTLQATALLHEALIKLSARLGTSSLSKADLIAAAAQSIRRVLVDHARSRRRIKRGANTPKLSIDGEVPAREPDDGDLDVEALHCALEQLAVFDPLASKLVELRFFAGLSVEDAAQILDISPRSAARLWNFAKSWLFVQLNGNS